MAETKRGGRVAKIGAVAFPNARPGVRALAHLAMPDGELRHGIDGGDRPLGHVDVIIR